MRFITAVILLLLVSTSARSQLFEENVGQIQRSEVLYFSRIEGKVILFTPHGLTFVNTLSKSGDSLVVSFPHNSSAQVVAEKQASHQLHYYTSRIQHTNVGNYERLRYRNIQPGIDIVYYIKDGHLKYDIEAEQGRLLEHLFLHYKNAELTPFGQGDLLVEYGNESSFVEDAPVSWVNNRSEQPVHVRYNVSADTLRWQVEPGFESMPIVVDPGVRWSLLNGGTSEEHKASVVTSSNNDVFVSASTESIEFGNGGFKGGTDVYVSKFNVQGALQWTVIYGGNARDDAADICLSADEATVYIVGSSKSHDLPTNRQITAPNPGGSPYGMIAQFAVSDGKHIASTRWGGGGNCEILTVAGAAGGDIVIGGKVASGWYHISSGAIQGTFNGPADGFVARLDADLLGYSWSTLFGSNATNDLEVITSICVTSSGDVGIAGYMGGQDAPITSNAFQPENQGHSDAIVGLLNGSTGDTIFSSYLGGGSSDFAYGITSDANGRLIVCGETLSGTFPTTAGAFKTTNTFNEDAFIAKVNPSNGGMVWSTLYGTDDKEDVLRAVTINGAGDIVATGSTGADEFPVIPPTFQNEYSGGREDAIVVAFSAAGQPVWNSYLGGSIWDQGRDIAALNNVSDGDVVVVGRTSSSNFPVTALPLGSQKVRAGNFDTFVTLFNTCAAPQPVLEDQELCQGEWVDLHPVNGMYEQYLWRESGNNELTNSSSSLRVTKPGKFSVVVTDGAGCSGVSNIASVDVLPMPDFEIVTSNPKGDTTFCAGDQLTMSVNGTNIQSVKWSTGHEGNTYTFNEPGLFSVDIFGENGCATSATFEVQEIDIPVPVVTPDTVVCRGEPVDLYVESLGTSFFWSGQNLQDVDKRSTRAYPVSDTEYIVRIEYRGCFATTTVSVSVVDAPSKPDHVELLACPDREFAIPLSYPGSVTLRNTEGTIVCADCPEDFLYRPSTSTTLTLEVANEAGCIQTTSIHISLRNSENVQLHSEGGDVVDFGVLQGCDVDILNSIEIVNSQQESIYIESAFTNSPVFEARILENEVPAGESTDIELVFAASETGQFNAFVYVVVGPCGDTLSLPLKGARTSSIVEISVDGSDFIGYRARCAPVLSTTLTVQNSGEEIVTLTGPVVGTGFTFAPGSDPTGTVLLIGESRSFTVQFEGATRGFFVENVGVEWESESCASESVVNLKAEATEPEIALSTSVVDFGTLSPCTTQSITTITITNTGNESLYLTDVVGNPAFVCELEGVVAPGASKQIEVRYNPQAQGVTTDDIQLFFEPCTISTTLSLSSAWWPPEFSVQEAIDVTVSACTEKTSQTIVLYNDSDEIVGTIASISVPDGFTYTVLGDELLGPGEQRPIQFSVSGDTPAGISSAVVTILVDGCEQSVFVNAVVRTVDTDIAIGEADFGTVPFNFVGTTTLTVTNSGASELTITSATLMGSGFQILSLEPSVLPPGQNSVVTIQFTAEQAGATTAALTIQATGLCDLVTSSLVSAVVEEIPKDLAHITINLSSHYVELKEASQAQTYDLPFAITTDREVFDALIMDVEYNRTVLHVENALAPAQLINLAEDGSIGVASILIPAGEVGNSAPGLVVTPLLGNATTSTLRVQRADSPNAVITSATGTVYVTGFCEEGGPRLVYNTEIPALEIANNGTPQATIVIKHARPESELHVYSADGRLVFKQVHLSAGSLHVATISPELASGIYVVSLVSERKMKSTVLQYNR